jgi:hypothetical protein
MRRTEAIVSDVTPKQLNRLTEAPPSGPPRPPQSPTAELPSSSVENQQKKRKGVEIDPKKLGTATFQEGTGPAAVYARAPHGRRYLASPIPAIKSIPTS